MVNLGLWSVPVQWSPPDSAKPGDTATLKFMHAAIAVVIPDGWAPGIPLLFEGPSKSPPVPAGPSKPGVNSEQLCGLATACIGVFGLVAGSVYLGSVVPGSLGYSLGLGLLLVAVGLWWIFERISGRDQNFRWLQSVLLAAALATAVATIGVVAVQTASNVRQRGDDRHYGGKRLPEVMAVLLVWLVVHIVFVLGALAYLRALPRMGLPGRLSATSFLPWFILVASCLVVGVASAALLVSWAGTPLGSIVINGVALVMGILSVGLGCLAPAFDSWLPGDSPESPQHPDDVSIAFLPSLSASLAVACLCALSLLSASDEASGEFRFVPMEVYTVVFLIALAAGKALEDVLRGYLLGLQLACLAALIAFVATEETPAFVAKPWLIAALAFAAVQWASRQAQASAEEADSEETQDADDEKIDLESLLFVQIFFNNYKDCLRIGGVLAMCAFATVHSFAWLGDKPTAAHVLLLAIPVMLLMLHVLLRGAIPQADRPEEGPHTSWDAPTVALFGIVAACLPIRSYLAGFISPKIWAECVLFDLSLIIYPLLMFLVSRAIVPLKTTRLRGQAAICLLAVLLCLLSLSLCLPIGFCVLGAAAFAVAWSLPGAAAMALTTLFWVGRGWLALRGEFDAMSLLVPEWVAGGLVSVVACAAVLAGVSRTNAEVEDKPKDLLPSIFLALLLPLPAVMPELSPLPMLCAIVVLELRPRWQHCLLCCTVILVGAAGCASLYTTEPFENWTVGFSVAGPVMALVGLRLTFFGEGLEGLETRRRAAAAAWIAGVACSFLAKADTRIDQCLAVLPLAGFSAALLASALPLQRALLALPGLWMALLSWRGLYSEAAWLVAATLGGLLMVLPALARRAPEALRGVTAEIEAWLEPVGLGWLVLGVLNSMYFGDLGIGEPRSYRSDVGGVIAIAVFMGVGMAELVLGLTFVKQAHSRRIGGLLCISIGIFCGAASSAGLLQGVLMLLGSLMTIGMAVLVAFSKGAEADAEANLLLEDESRDVLLNAQGM